MVGEFPKLPPTLDDTPAESCRFQTMVAIYWPSVDRRGVQLAVFFVKDM